MMAFDIDGTLLEHPGRPDYLSEFSLSQAHPIRQACSRVRALIDAGTPVTFITGRSHQVRGITLQQLREHVHPDIDGEWLVTQATFTTYEAMVTYKAKVLRYIKAVGYVGDHTADYQAATEAGVPFLHAVEWAAGVELE